ncbi:AAA domain-containing protein, putative AbiEii toxin, Type IV TA system [Pseudomonas sp. NFPP10]|nr:AAA domain-containing protein, putative AbiEii toxin, Type IV TA system [Pseudomonas sp. NFPP12]SEL75671.1 AAA domain-containing protein, putative AbiEii toxin, Type IV TA system [Pseudomonas sp. NFPP10]SFJ52221.1 AAA domain-containing protein, putative AbiEii toxin, Type IV TA system [Pseudomonas sp. NFPP08]SFM90620.1 AAA domain-containing protein, putative AbiEii toxin, Type IV TA system [Pseudomonas sp. NFPP05]SFX64118.1 AAA domain-containing protein, putative AbiEii toxin, Type IV TA sys
MWSVRFSNTEPLDLEREMLHIIPIDSNWNDFGYRYSATLKLMYAGIYLELPIYVIPLSSDPEYSELSSWIKSLDKDQVFNIEESSPPLFLSLFKDIDCYEKIARNISKTDIQNILKQLGDITFLKSSGLISSVQHDQFIYSSQFRLGVLRNPAAWKAFRRGFFNARYTQKLDDAKVDFSYDCQLAGYPGKHSVHFQFKNHRYFDDRVHCIIGINGVGKTRYLESLISSLCQSANSRANFPTPTVLTYSNSYAAHTDTSTTLFRELPSYHYVLSYSSDFDTALPTGCNLGGPFQYRYFDISARTKERPGTEPLGLLFADIYREQDSFDPAISKYSILKSSLSEVLDFDSILLPVVNQYDGDFSFEDHRREKWVKVRSLRGELKGLEILGAIDPARDITISDDQGRPSALSSGQRAFLRFALHFLSYAENGTLVLIDEPETHLHPNMISQFMVLLYQVLQATNSVAIIATHSVYVAREIPSHCAHIFSHNEDGTIETLQVYTKTLGANVNTLSRTIFDDSTVKSYTSKIINEVAASGLSFAEVLAQYEDIFSVEMLVEIRAVMGDVNFI